MKKRLLSVLLAICMILPLVPMLPMSAVAAEADVVEIKTVYDSISHADMYDALASAFGSQTVEGYEVSNIQKELNDYRYAVQGTEDWYTFDSAGSLAADGETIYVLQAQSKAFQTGFTDYGMFMITKVESKVTLNDGPVKIKVNKGLLGLSWSGVEQRLFDALINTELSDPAVTVDTVTFHGYIDTSSIGYYDISDSGGIGLLNKNYTDNNREPIWVGYDNTMYGPVTVIFVANEYTVTYTDGANGAAFPDDQYTVADGAATPEFSGVPSRDGYVFTGWDKEIASTVTADVTYTATWEEYCTVTWYDADGVTLLETDSGILPSSNTVPVYNGVTTYSDKEYVYTISGWDANGDRVADTVGAVTGDVSYVAIYSKVDKEYAINWVNNDGTEVCEPTTGTYNGTHTYPGNVDELVAVDQEEGKVYKFDQWVRSEDLTNAVITYTATYSTEASKHTVTWDAGEGAFADGETTKTTTVEYGATPVPPAVNLVKDAYTFAGWTPSVSAVTGDITYTATYTQKPTYDVKLVKNDGSEDSVSTPIIEGEVYTLLADTFAYGIHEFAGWNTQADGKGTSYAAGDKITVNEAVTLYAQWNYNWTVSYDSGVASEVVANGKTATKPADPAKDGYRFDGWLLNGEAYDFATPVTGDVALTAKWVQQVTVTFIAPNGVVVDPIKGDIGMKVTLVAPDLGEDLVFVGWRDLNTGTLYKAGDELTVNNNVELSAAFNYYVKVEFAANGASNTMDPMKVLANTETALNASTLIRSGWAFKGWSTTATGSVEYADGANIKTDKDIILYAVWEEIPVVVIPTTVVPTNASVTVTYGSFDNDDLLDLIKPVVKDEDGNVIADAVVTIELSGTDAGEQTATLYYAGTSADARAITVYAASSATATVIVEKATASVVVSSQTAKYGETLSDPFSANCATINVLAGLDAHDETYLVGTVQVSVPEDMFATLASAILLNNMMGGRKIDLNDLTIDDVKYIINLVKTGSSMVEPNDSVNAVIATLEEYEAILEKLVSMLEEIQAQLPMDSELKVSLVSEISLPTNIGLYVAASLSADNNYTTDMDAGYIVITPNGVKVNLAWNQNDDNHVVTLGKMADFDLTASASVVESTLEGATLEDVYNHLDYLFIGVNANGDLVINRVRANSGEDMNAILGDTGAYAQVAYISNWDNVMYYAEPLVRPIIVSPNVADVAILDVNGNNNYAQVFTYDGNPHGVTVTVNGKTGVDGLVVKYIGSDTTVDGWYRSEAPTDAGVYTVVAVYTEKNAAGELVTAGAAIGVIVINPADAEVGLDDAKYAYDAAEHFATITNNALDYITVAIDRTNNIAYVNVPADTADHIDRLIAMLPAELEEKVNAFIAKYSGFDGDVSSSTVKEELVDIINQIVAYDLTTATVNKTEALVDALVAELKENVDVQAAVAKLKAELEALKTKIGNEIPDEIEAQLVDYIKAVVTVTDSNVEIDVDKIKSDLKAKIKELEAELPASVVAELYEMVDEVIAAVENHVDVDAVTAKVKELVSVIETIDSEDAETLIKYVIGAAYGLAQQADLSEVKALVKEVIAKVEVQGYVDYAKNMLNSITSIYSKDIDFSAVEASVDALIAKIEEKFTTGNFDRDDIMAVESYVDDILASLITVVDQIPDCKIVFGKNPTEIGIYDCYAINVSANYKAEFVSATLEIVKAECTHPNTETNTSITPAQCETPGSMTVVVTCKDCGVIISSETTPIPKTGHVKTDVRLVDSYAPTCTTDGWANYEEYCTVCGKVISEERHQISKTGHDMKETEKEVAPTCTNVGKTAVYTCANDGCGKTEGGETVPETGHIPGTEVIDPSTQTTDGSYDLVVYCRVCGVELSRRTVTAPAPGHTHTEEVIPAVAPTCIDKGSTAGLKCSVCNEILVAPESVPATGHTPAEAVKKNVVEATETTDGSYDLVVYCSVCGAEISRETVTVPALGHTHTEEVLAAVAPTCTDTGLTEGKKCSACGEILVVQEIVAALGHTPAEAVKENVVEATETTEGSYDLVVYCSVCGAEISRQTVTVPAAPATGDNSVFFIVALIAIAIVCGAVISFKKRDEN